MARGGRPPKPPGERRSEVIRFRVTPEEADDLYRRARAERTTVAALVRACFRSPERTATADMR